MHKPTINALIATVLALGEAAGSATLQRAGGNLRHLIADGVVDPETEGSCTGFSSESTTFRVSKF
jgi:hypothetical protein